MEGICQLVEAIKNALTWWVTVAPWEQAVRARAGKHVSLLGPGIHLRVPILDRVYVQSIRRRLSTVPPQTLTTRDGKALTIVTTVGYRISDLLLLYNTLHHAEGTIVNMVTGAVGDFVIERELAECAPAGLAAEVELALDMRQHGIADVTVKVSSFVSVKTYRFITGEGYSYSYGDHLETSIEAGKPKQ